MWKLVIASKCALIHGSSEFWTRRSCVDGVDASCIGMEHL